LPADLGPIAEQVIKLVDSGVSEGQVMEQKDVSKTKKMMPNANFDKQE
jgi:type III restriction enzyme